uniref:Putative transcriptional regulator FixK n=1 Tax=uncultured bacterium 1062 TaxID=548898 RepID=B8R8X5_9BACT|nr:putative transcriptional regulator FixK [uncultured bacterium 1062]
MHIQSTFRASQPNTSPRAGVSDLLTAMQPAAVTLFPADAVIYAQGEAAGPLYLVEFGTVRLCRLTADGRRLVSAFHTAGEVFGFEAGSEHDSYAESVDGAGIRVLRASCGQQPTGSMLLLALKSLARTQNHLMVLGRRNANERMAALLLDLAERQGDGKVVHLPMQRNDIADYLGITFETVSRILRVLKDQGVIRLRSISDIEILDLAALEDMCD